VNRYLVLLTLAACTDSIRPEAEPDAGGDAAPAGPVSTVDHGDGTFTTRVDATSAETWTRVEPWQLAAQRFHLDLDDGVEVAPVPGTLASVTAAPAAGWLADRPDGDDPDYAFERGDGWYAYDVQTHVLTPRPLVWVVRAGDGALIKLVIEDYYDDAGTSGVFTVHWSPLP
jgi:hypothetical protein